MALSMASGADPINRVGDVTTASRHLRIRATARISRQTRFRPVNLRKNSSDPLSDPANLAHKNSAAGIARLPR